MIGNTTQTQLCGANERRQRSGNLWHILEASSGSCLNSQPHHINFLHTSPPWADTEGSDQVMVCLQTLESYIVPTFGGSIIRSPEISVALPNSKTTVSASPR